HDALGRDPARKHHVEGADAVGGHDEQLLPEVVDVTDLAPPPQRTSGRQRLQERAGGVDAIHGGSIRHEEMGLPAPASARRRSGSLPEGGTPKQERFFRGRRRQGFFAAAVTASTRTSPCRAWRCTELPPPPISPFVRPALVDVSTRPGTSTCTSPGSAVASSTKRLPAETSSRTAPCAALAHTGSVSAPAGVRLTPPRSTSTRTSPRNPSMTTSAPDALICAPFSSTRAFTPPCATLTWTGPPTRASTTSPKLVSATSPPATSAASTAPWATVMRASPPAFSTRASPKEPSIVAAPVTSRAVTGPCCDRTSTSPRTPSTPTSPNDARITMP